MTPYVPELPPDCEMLKAALAYAEAGWFVLPIDPAGKHAGSVLGKGWQYQTSRDPKVITSWFAGTGHALALHIGRSGAVAFDVDTPAEMPLTLRMAVTEHEPPFQSTRDGDPERGHYLFAAAPGRFGNSGGDLGASWGDVRGLNGIVVVAPTPHSKAAQGGRYAWARTGVLPPIPQPLAACLRPPGASAGTADGAAVCAFLDALPGGEPCPAVAALLTELPASGRHEEILPRTQRLTRLGEQGHHGAGAALETLREMFVQAVEADRIGGAAEAEGEYSGALAGAVAAVLAAPTPAAKKGCCGSTREAERWAAMGIDVTGLPVVNFEAPSGSDSAVTPAPASKRLRATALNSVTARATRWLWKEPGSGEVGDFLTPAGKPACWLPLGGLSLLAGREGTGKSTWGYRLAALVTRGQLPGAFYGTPKAVIVVAGEDSFEHTIVPRLLAAKADLSKVYRVDAVIDDVVDTLTLPRDVVELHEQCAELDAALVLLDPLMSTLAAGLDSHKDHEVRVALDPLARLAHDAQVTIVGLIHQNKSSSGDLLTRVMASKAFAAVARAVLFCAKEEPEPGAQVEHETFLFGQAKSNLGAKVAHSLRYHVEGVKVGRDEELGEDIWSSCIEVEKAVTGRIDELVSAQENRTTARETVTDRAEKWLREYLAGKVGVPSAEVKAAGKNAGFSSSALDRCKVGAGVKVTPIPGTHNQTTWTLDDTSGGNADATDVTDVTDISDVTDVTHKEQTGTYQGVTSVTSRVRPPARGDVTPPSGDRCPSTPCRRLGHPGCSSGCLADRED